MLVKKHKRYGTEEDDERKRIEEDVDQEVQRELERLIYDMSSSDDPNLRIIEGFKESDDEESD